MMLYMKNLKEQVIWNWFLDRKLSEKRMFPAIDIAKSGTRREDLLAFKRGTGSCRYYAQCTKRNEVRRGGGKILNMFERTKNNEEFVQIKKTKFIKKIKKFKIAFQINVL